ncbi:hypothetical protein GCM10009819_16230 [Agromyces tropicus]|uniref:Uncharacterized protein n=1 Tax=Agromyces tropicus TaxID=555371 RepID=A0ABP5FU62_9MICO
MQGPVGAMTTARSIGETPSLRRCWWKGIRRIPFHQVWPADFIAGNRRDAAQPNAERSLGAPCIHGTAAQRPDQEQLDQERPAEGTARRRGQRQASETAANGASTSDAAPAARRRAAMPARARA